MIDFDTDGISDRINEITALPSAHFSSDEDTLRFCLSALDLTSLEGKDTIKTIENLCAKASSFNSVGLPNVAAVCVYPVFIRQAKSLLAGMGIKTASVAGAFPSGQSPKHIRLSEIQYAVDEGADEIDIVINRGKYLEKEYEEVYNDVLLAKEICKNVHLKVILETGELESLSNIYHASKIALEAGADFIKTSTGKILPAATPEAAFVMLSAIKDYYLNTGRKAGFKPAGGISTPEHSLVYIKLVENICGSDWLNIDLFRLGASSLATNLVARIKSKE